MNVFYKLKDTALKGIEKAVDGVDKTRDLVNKQNQQTKVLHAQLRRPFTTSLLSLACPPQYGTAQQDSNVSPCATVFT